MEHAFNVNTKVFSDGMQMLEAQNAVLRRVIQDLAGGVLLTTEESAPEVPIIDFNKYLQEYIEQLMAAEEAAAKTPEPEVKLSTPDDDSPIIFGGDVK